jgi:predicted nucleic acid-binding protein
VAGVVIDTSAWIRFFSGSDTDHVAEALEHGAAVLPPIVVSELITGANTQTQRQAIGELLQDAPVHATPLGHWIRVGDLRQALARKGLAVTIPDAHVAQCALDLDAVLLSADGVFSSIARHVPLRLGR